MDINNLFEGAIPWIIAGVASVLLFVSKAFRDLIRWIVFLPLSFAIALALNLINFVDMIVGLLFKQISYVISIIVDAFTIAQDLFFVLLVAKLIAPKGKIGVIIASTVCLLVESYNLYSKKVCTIFPIAYDKIDSIDWINSGILLGVSLSIIFIFCSQLDYDD